MQVRGSGRLDPTPYEVYGWAADATGAETEIVRFSPLDVVDPAYAAGVYGGVVILSHGGDWTLKTAVLEVRKRPHDPPVPLTGGELTVARSGPALAQARAGVDRLARPRANIFNTVVLGLHSLSAAAIEDVTIKDGENRPIMIEIQMNNSSGIFQVDGLLKAKLRGSGLEPYVEVIAHIDTEEEKRLVPVFRLGDLG